MIDSSDPFKLKRCLIELIGPLVHNRPVILTGGAYGSGLLAQFFKAAGAKCIHNLDLTPEPGLDLYIRLFRQQERLANPTSTIRDTLDTLDPNRTAIIYAGSFVADQQFCGREIIGNRKQCQFEAERKDQQMCLTRVGGNKVNLANRDTAIEVVQDMVHRTPTVISGIPEHYLALGTSHTYLALDAAVVPKIIRALAQDCRQVILAPFDIGVPCTFYGFVCKEWIIHFGPFEALVYWNQCSGRLHALGILRPLVLNYEQKVAAACRVREIAQLLNRKTDYCGAFCTDGVLQKSNYIIHEINPRVCAGFSLLTKLFGGQVSLSLVDLALRACPALPDNLYVALKLLADWTDKQEPAIRLWDPKQQSLEKHLQNQVSNYSDTTTWLEDTRKTLIAEFGMPLISNLRHSR